MLAAVGRYKLTDQHEKIVLFDAMCVLCSANAQFILSRDKHKKFLLASMQGDVGARLFAENGINPADPSTFLVIDNGLVHKESDAVLSIYEGLPFPWNLARVFRVIPRVLRDPVYRFVARNRYRFFNKRDTCWMPSEKFRSRIL